MFKTIERNVGVELAGIEISKCGGRAFAKTNNDGIEIKDYTICATGSGKTQVVITIEFDNSEFMEFSSGAMKGSLQQLNSIAKNDAP